MVDNKISELDAAVGISGIDVFPFASIGSTLTKKVTFDNFETNLTISGALVTDISNLTTVSGAGVVVSGATVTNKNNLTTVSGAGVAVSGAYVATSGALVADIANLVTVSGAGVAVSGALVSDIANLVTVSGAGVVVSGALVTDIANLVTVSGAGVAVSGAGATHQADNTQAHTDYLLNNANDSSTGSIVTEGLTVTGDRSSADAAYVPMVLYNTDDTPPAASGFPVGTIYVQYTA